MKLCDTCIYRNNVEQLKPCIIYRDDCTLYERGDMSNKDAVNIIKSGLDNNSIDCFDTKQYMAIDMAIKALKQEPKKCKDCKWWKDSDGVFRRGIGAESQCPMNRIEVYEGNGYCHMFEPQESDNCNQFSQG